MKKLFVLLPLAAGGLLLFLGRSKASPAPEPEPEPPPEPRISPCPPMGDVDGDGWVTEEDALLIAQFLAGTIYLTPEQIYRAKVWSGMRPEIPREQPVIQDALVIIKYVKGKIDTFLVCPIGEV